MAALAIVQAVRAWQGAADVELVYQAPPGPLRVTLLEEREMLRRVEFAAGAERRHEARLPVGRYRARMELPDRPPAIREFVVDEVPVVIVRW